MQVKTSFKSKGCINTWEIDIQMINIRGNCASLSGTIMVNVSEGKMEICLLNFPEKK